MRFNKSLAVFALFVLLCHSSIRAQNEASTTWLIDGKKMDAEFVRLTDDGVVLRRLSDRREGEVPLSRLDLDGRLAAIKLGHPEAFSKPVAKAAVSETPISTAANSAEVPAKLDEEVHVQGFSIRPPFGYERGDKDGPLGLKRIKWSRPPWPDGSTSMVQLLVVAYPKEEESRGRDYMLANAFAGFEDSFKGSLKWSRSSQIRIGGVQFAKRHWTSIDGRTGTTMQGIIYLGISGGQMIYLQTGTTKAHSETLKIGEKSILSFRLARK